MARVEMFTKWLNGLIEEDKQLGIHPVNRGDKAEKELYLIYKKRKTDRRKH